MIPDPTFEKRLAIARETIQVLALADRTPLPVHIGDQVDAATKAAHAVMQRVPETQPGTGYTYRPIDLANHYEIAARMEVAVATCEMCPHLRKDSIEPMWAILALRRINCMRCCRTMRMPPRDEDDRCDWCGARGVEIFTMLSMQNGPLLIGGDACEDCAAVLVLPA